MAENGHAPDVAPFAFSAEVTLCIDFKNPYSYLAKDPSYALEDEFDLRIDWQPLRVAPLTPPQPRSSVEDRGSQHRRMRAEYNEADLERYVRIRGLTLKHVYRNPESKIAGIGLLWAKRFSPDVVRGYVDRVFDRYWNGTFDMEDPRAIGGLLDEVGADSDGFAGYVEGEGTAAFSERQAALRAAGLFNVPGYVVDGEVFYGRQHLPMIRWILSGRAGAGPI